MKVIHKNQTIEFKNSDVCVGISYPLGDSDINGAVVELSGRYPSQGRVMNEKCKELGYVISGSGKIVIEDKEIILDQGDLVLIDKGEKYYWDGKMTMFMPCVPAWDAEQHKEVV